MSAPQKLIVLCRGNTRSMAELVLKREPGLVILCAATIAIGCAIYGGAIGIWRGPQQALYTAIKFPLLIFLTCGANALLNGMLAQVFGSGLGFRQTSTAILMSFTVMAIILAGLTPVSAFILANSPPLESEQNKTGHAITLLGGVAFIAYAGVVGNVRLLAVLRQICPTAVARRVFWGWLAGNLFLGAQLSWIFRPFIGSPGLEIQFLRDDPLRGNFYEAVFHTLKHFINS
ncbi:MAG TPA: hypothetical protein VIT21_02940 [Chthoniobacterales bacterium]